MCVHHWLGPWGYTQPDRYGPYPHGIYNLEGRQTLIICNPVTEKNQHLLNTVSISYNYIWLGVMETKRQWLKRNKSPFSPPSEVEYGSSELAWQPSTAKSSGPRLLLSCGIIVCNLCSSKVAAPAQPPFLLLWTVKHVTSHSLVAA